MGNICTNASAPENDDERLYHWLGHVTGLYWKCKKPIFAEVSEN